MNQQQIENNKRTEVLSESWYDQRDVVFVRSWLQPGTELYETYYAKHPELEEMVANMSN